MKKNVMITVVVLIFSLVGIILSGQSYAIDVKENNWSINFNNLTSSIKGNPLIPENPSLEVTSIKAFDILLEDINDSVSYSFDIINEGSMDAKLSVISKVEPKCISLEIPGYTEDEEMVCNNLEYKFVYTKNDKELAVGDIIKANSKENITLKVKVNNVFDELKGHVQVTFYDTNFIFDQAK